MIGGETCKNIASEVGLSLAAVQSILTNILGMSNVWAKMGAADVDQ